ncbi:phage Gp37/Gp68 family protein [Burkholderia multivorans]|uniref:phage Gp37/Gp68 family protein n=1 Tax=Burkholderia multivorans TaxID=87883 RepID=UPI000D34BE6D|nr:phage Gp37/Gp68 family protein [Burkholderia multivorans]MBR8020184.1 phage Gp37/Gp68 family protein [Burkholderia multivorans]MEB2511592.1 phage Gp37/Gp68 family protein [Burkholderia multivorans]MEB2521204.1 phage Gp37/Gp68 family protein [Burkholderia multivorans]MEB2573383.1 phage Gp37/Gp68 family protein [Burkholderia multivorans]MEB2590543.1 phage Gp37/Gp68 family protein [Burkholderia multivorans]
MSENTSIEWCDQTFNPWEGCQKVDHCYAETRNARFAGGIAVNWGPGAPRRRTSAANWRRPLAWDAVHAEFFAAHGRRQRVFCASLADVFDNAVPDAWRADLFDLIWNTPHLDWLLLTKRIGNAGPMIARALELAGGNVNAPWPSANVWLGATIVNQAEANRDVPKLLSTPARVRFLSMEPLLGPVNLAESGALWSDMNGNIVDATARGLRGVDWVIAGGESGPGARPMHPDWARALRDQCAAAGVPFLFKQWGEWAPGENCGGPPTRTERVADWFGDTWSFHMLAPSAHEGLTYDDEPTVYRVGKKTAGRHLDGRTHDEFPVARI